MGDLNFLIVVLFCSILIKNGDSVHNLHKIWQPSELCQSILHELRVEMNGYVTATCLANNFVEFKCKYMSVGRFLEFLQRIARWWILSSGPLNVLSYMSFKIVCGYSYTVFVVSSCFYKMFSNIHPYI